MKSYLSLSPALNQRVVTVREGQQQDQFTPESRNCTFGVHFELPFPGEISVVEKLLKLYDLTYKDISPSDYKTLLSLARAGISANDNGLFALSRLYLVKLYREIYRIVRSLTV
jgi:hypothetical protein